MDFKKIAIIVLFALLLISRKSNAFAEDKFLILTETQKIYSDNPFYPIKRLWEKIALKMLFLNDAKVNYEKKLLNKRFSELKYSVKNNLLDEIQRTSERFSYQAGIYADKVRSYTSKESKQKVIQEFAKYASDAAVLRKQVPEGSFTRLIQYDIDTLNILSNQLK